MGVIDEAIDIIADDDKLRLTWYIMAAIIGLTAIGTAAAYPLIIHSALGSALLTLLNELRSEANTTYASGGYPMLAAFIFAHNTLVDALDYALLILLVTPVVMALVNGFVLGFVSVYTLPLHGNMLVVDYFLMPHGVIEIPAFALVGAAVVLIRKGVDRLYIGGAYLLITSILMLAISAMVEAFVTPFVGALVFHLTGGAGP